MTDTMGLSERPAMRMETATQNLARDVMEGRFPARSEPKLIPAIADPWDRIDRDPILASARRKISIEHFKAIIDHVMDYAHEWEAYRRSEEEDAKDARIASQAKLIEEMRGPRIFIDCEFNGWMGELLSFAMVAEDGQEFYAVLPEPRIWDKWCFENVLPVLGKQPVASYEDFRLAFLEFLRGFANPTIIADWPADLYYFNSVLLGRSHTESVMRPCRMQLVACDYDSAIPHNALEDARAIKVALSKLESQS